jgi:Domain of unknown function (DUF4160)
MPAAEGGREPEISRFLGIVVAMFYKDHPPANFHVRYGDQRAIIDIGSLARAQHSIRINDQWRVCFVWRGGDAHDVEIVDYP